MRIKKMNWFLKLICKNSVTAITLAPFGVYVRDYFDHVGEAQLFLIRHEMIHWKQQTEMLFVFFYIWYFVEWAIKCVFFMRGADYAYRNISFEKEAYYNEWVPDYPIKRKPFAWVYYMRTQP